MHGARLLDAYFIYARTWIYIHAKGTTHFHLFFPDLGEPKQKKNCENSKQERDDLTPECQFTF